MGCFLTNHPFWGTPIYGNPQIIRGLLVFLTEPHLLKEPEACHQLEGAPRALWRRLPGILHVGAGWCSKSYGGFHKWKSPRWFIWTITTKMDDDWGCPYFRKTPYTDHINTGNWCWASIIQSLKCWGCYDWGSDGFALISGLISRVTRQMLNSQNRLATQGVLLKIWTKWNAPSIILPKMDGTWWKI